MSVSDEVERAAADTTSSDCVTSGTLLPIVPIGYKNRPVGVALPRRRDSAMEEEAEPLDQDHSNSTPQLKQDLAPDYLKKIDSSSDDSICSNEHSPRTPFDHTPFDHTHHNAPQFPLPYNKKYHVFITHSTFNDHMIKPKLKEPLTGPPHYLSVCCSSDFMEGSEYNNDAIRSMMQQSCVIVIGISESYLKSFRCVKEWRKAVEYTRNIIVIAFGPCSRPMEIKNFLYLDLMDDSKRHTVWDKFMQKIQKFMSLLQDQFRPPSPALQADNFGMTQLFDSMTSQHTEQQGSGLWGTNVTTDHHEVEEITGKGFEDNFMEMDAFYRPFEGGSGEEVGLDMSSSQWGGAKCSDEENEEGEGVKNEDELAEMVEGEETVGNKEREHQREEGELSDTGSPPDEEGGEPAMKCPRLEGSADEETTQSQEVAGFYDSLAKPGADNRNESPIFHMRNFNNWVKSILIRTNLKSRGMTVLDMCCGKGGDLNKWKEGGIDHVVCADISEVSIQRCKERYESRKMYYRGGKHAFDAQFIVGDCCEVQLREKYDNPARRFGMTSCQFSLHYSFESYERATMMLRNACENLVPGGHFIGTTVDANELVRRVRENGCRDDTGAWSVGNDLYSVTFDEGIDPHNDSLPLFNCKYHFKLEGVVNVPEYLVHFPLLVKMLEEFGMKEVLHQNLYDFFEEHRYIPEDVRLLYNMHAFDKNGTMTRSQWEAIGLYLVFVFKKEQPLTNEPHT